MNFLPCLIHTFNHLNFAFPYLRVAYLNDKRIHQVIALFQGAAALPAGKISRRQVHGAVIQCHKDGAQKYSTTS